MEIPEIKLVSADRASGFLDFIYQMPDLNEHELRRMVLENEAQAFFVQVKGENIGALVVGREDQANDRWMIVHALKCDPVAGLDVTKAVFDQLHATAQATGCAGIRCWTRRNGLRRKLENLGAKSRYVMEFKI